MKLLLISFFALTSMTCLAEPKNFLYERRDADTSEPVCDDRVDSCQLAKLIYKSQSAPRATQRANAILAIGNSYNCKINPEVFAATIFSLHDATEEVRIAAARVMESGLQKESTCCFSEISKALQKAINDDPISEVRDAAGAALKLCPQ